MFDLSEFQPKPHTFKPTFDRYPRAVIANALGISSSFLSNVLCGTRKPSAELEARIVDLAEKIEAEK